jgi:hypothetical protein
MTELISEEDWDNEKFRAWSKLHNLREMTSSELFVSDDEQNLVALIVGEQMFLNADFIESIHGRYNQTTEEKSDDGDGDDLEAA